MLKRLGAACSRAYGRLMGRASTQRLNDFVLRAVLRAKGYGNYGNFSSSGERHFLDSLRDKGLRCCVDIGANVGDYAIALMDRMPVRVVAFEPLAISFGSLQRVADRYGEKLTAFQLALGNSAGELQLSYGDLNPLLATLQPAVSEIEYVDRNNTKTATVKVETLDRFVDGHRDLFECIDLIKIDTEGYEFEVLQGAAETLRSFRPPFVQLEYNWHQLFTGHSLWQISKLLNGYHVYQMLPYSGGLRRIDPRAPESNIFQYSNFVFSTLDSL